MLELIRYIVNAIHIAALVEKDGHCNDWSRIGAAESLKREPTEHVDQLEELDKQGFETLERLRVMKADIREAIDTLNSNAVEGIAQLRQLGFESDYAVANVLIAARGVDRSVMGNFLHKEEGKSVCREIARSYSKERGTVVDAMLEILDTSD